MTDFQAKHAAKILDMVENRLGQLADSINEISSRMPDKSSEDYYRMCDIAVEVGGCVEYEEMNLWREMGGNAALDDEDA